MASIIWDNRLETGLEEMDAQHRTLVDTFNRLTAVVAGGGRNRKEMEGLLLFLSDFTRVHFELEQELMAQCGYPDEAHHRTLHSDLAAQIDTLLDIFHQGRTGLTPAIMEYLDAWLQRHIREEDFRLAEFLKHAGPPQKGMK